MRRRPEQSLDTLFEQPGTPGSNESREHSRVPFAAAGPGPERALLHGELTALLRETIEELPRDYRTVVKMRHFEEARIAEIAARLEITPNAAKLRLLRAHRALRVLLARRGYDRTGRQ
jgi:RNA polymerase sigma factor (sigma-70 family)